MKHNRFFYYIAIAASLGFLIGFINYTKGAIPTQKLQTSEVASGEKHHRGATSLQTTATPDAQTVEKDACGCCSQLRKRIEQRRQQARERKFAKDKASPTHPLVPLKKKLSPHF